MCVEYAQLLSTAHRVLDGELWYGRTTNGRKIARYLHPDTELQQVFYLASHINHPSNQWVRASEGNYTWMYDMWTALCSEYQYRYGRVHESFRKLEYALLIPPANIKCSKFFQPTPAMGNRPECIVEGDSLQSYRNYYWSDKRPIAKWTKREAPKWWKELELDEQRQQA
tara:strand:+ start:3885 stop:4391 length:507 start_codon:yes stop_codon:yes gene_type:complete